MARPKAPRICENPDCRKSFSAFSGKQVYCQEPACREIQRLITKNLQRNFHRNHPKPKPKAEPGKTCFLCGKPLRDGERINHVACINKRSYRRIDGDYLYV